MARGPFWLCTEVRVIRENLHLTDREIAELLPNRDEKAVQSYRLRHGLAKPPRKIGRLRALEAAYAELLERVEKLERERMEKAA